MALTMNYTDVQTGANYPNAYIKVESNMTGKNIQIDVRAYASAQARLDGKNSLQGMNEVYNLDNPTPIPTGEGLTLENAVIKAGYLFLKTLPAYQDAVDC